MDGEKDKEVVDDKRYFVSATAEHYRFIKQVLIEEGKVDNPSDVIFVTLDPKNRKKIRKDFIPTNIPSHQLVGRWMQGELKYHTKDSSRPYTEEIKTEEQQWLDNVVSRFEKIRTMEAYKRRMQR